MTFRILLFPRLYYDIRKRHIEEGFLIRSIHIYYEQKIPEIFK